MNKRGILTVISGFSGVGKGTIVKKLLNDHDQYALSISATTRAPRAGEQEGREYFFKTREEFESMIQHHAFIEYAQFVNNYYGTPKAYVEEKLSEGKDVILEIEIQGAMKIKAQFPDALTLFVVPPSPDVLKERLTGRGTESADVIASRLQRAVEEAKGMDQYEYLVVNDDLDTCVKEVHSIIQSEHFKSSRNIEFRENLAQGMKKFLKGDK